MTLDEKPGFRRRIVITPHPGEVTAALEDDIHCMAMTLIHDGEAVTGVSAQMDRWPWSTCPGAREVAEQSFIGAPLTRSGRIGDKRQNCTHLYDLAEWALVHALDAGPTQYDVQVDDPVAGRAQTRIMRNGDLVMEWTLEGNDIVAPEGLAGLTLFTLRDWIASLDGPMREAARILQWASLVAHGRQMEWVMGAKPTHMSGQCYSFQPDRAAIAKRIGERRDFSSGGRAPLSHLDGEGFAC